MIDSDISTEEIESYQDYVGRSITETEAVGTHVCQRMSAALDTDDTGSELPPLWHYGLFLTQVGTPDGRSSPAVRAGSWRTS